jgi:hypothetical protein
MRNKTIRTILGRERCRDIDGVHLGFQQRSEVVLDVRMARRQELKDVIAVGPEYTAKGELV